MTEDDESLGGVMGPNMDHVDVMAKALCQTIVNVLAKHGYERPQPISISWTGRERKVYFGHFGHRWDVEVQKLEEVLKEMLELDACAKF